MPNKKSAKKRVKTNELSHKRNVARKSEIKTIIKSFVAAIEDQNLDQAKELLKTATSKIARASGKGVFKKNKGSRQISKLSKKFNSAGSSAS